MTYKPFETLEFLWLAVFLVKQSYKFLFSRKTLGFIFRDVLVEKVLWPIQQVLEVSTEDFGVARITQI